MDCEATTAELCRTLYQEILVSVKSSDQLKPYSVCFSAVLSNEMNSFEKELRLLMKQSGGITKNQYLENDDLTLNTNGTAEPQMQNDYVIPIEKTDNQQKSIEENLMRNYDEIGTTNGTETREKVGSVRRSCRPREEWDEKLQFLRRHSMDEPQSLSGEHRSLANVNENAMKKRHTKMRKTIASRSEMQHLLRNQQEVQLKNTNRNMHTKNELYRTLCQLCNKNERFLVKHYMNQHPGSEVLISRLPPTMADRLRSQNDKFDIANRIISGFCYFCEELKCMTKRNWTEHILTHTGEKIFYCSVCHFESRRKLDHKNCKNEPVNIYEANTKDGSLTGFICVECNYLQIQHKRMIKHLVRQHGWDKDEVTEDIQYEKVVLIPDLLPVKVTRPVEFNYIETAKRFKCSVCAKKTNNAEAFEEHFDREHCRSIKEYKCMCGEKIAIDGFLNGDKILEHLYLHSANLYQCMYCEISFFDIDGIQDHLLNDHTNCQYKFQRIHRKPDSQAIFSEIIATKLMCNICNVELDAKFTIAIEHFKQEHPKESIDFSGSLSKKISQMARKTCDIKTKYVSSNSFTLKIN
ncbi:zinc finger and BTB domain-containing protein 41-like [Contarinia nasturtii]|uniref:zinc finger and BTB domain-containing protein 41-like n=1 Tax=Contarinia nasturtii TaxID=265458 RepID=UPI0012D399B3|nr:zinc finger and BTB domain-containing protein 41-like [Contarinia nasturtii]